MLQCNPKNISASLNEDFPVEEIGLLMKPLNSAHSSRISERGSILQKATTIFQCGCAGILDIMVTTAT
jgi:hypothetical protein